LTLGKGDPGRPAEPRDAVDWAQPWMETLCVMFPPQYGGLASRS